MLVVLFPEIAPLNIMKLGSPLSAILSAVSQRLSSSCSFPWPSKGEVPAHEGHGHAQAQSRHLRARGLLVPFVGIKIIDIAVNYSICLRRSK